MMKIFTSVLVFSLFFNSFAQEIGKWEVLNEGISSWLDNIYFLNDNVGWLSSNPIYKTEDGGETWKEIKILYSDVNSVANPKMTSEAIGWAVDHNCHAILRTADGGQNWHLVYEIANQNYQKVYLNAVSDSLAYLVNSYRIGDEYISSIIKTKDAGDNWIEVLPDFYDRQLREIQLVNNDLALVLGRVVDDRDGELEEREGSILRTRNGGDSWDETLLSEGIYAQNLQYINDSTAYFLAESYMSDTNTHKGYIYTSTDSGKSWSSIFETEDAIVDYHFSDSETGYAIKTDNLGNTHIMKSTDRGESWGYITAIEFGNHKIYFLNPTTGFHLDGNDLWKTTDGGKTWVRKIFTYPFKDVEFVNNQKGFACGGIVSPHGARGDVFNTNDGGKTWKKSFKSNRWQVSSCYFVNEFQGFLLSDKIYKTEDAGNTWIPTSDINIDSTFRYNLNDISFNNQEMGWIVGWYYNDYYESTGALIVRTQDGGENWEIDWQYPDDDDVSKGLISFYFVNSTGWAVGNGGIIVKYTEQNHWQLQDYVTDLPLNDIFFTDEKHGWITGGYLNEPDFRSILLKTSNGGETWTDIGLDQYLINDMYFADSLHGWAVGNDTTNTFSRYNYCGVILETYDGGESWNPVVENLSAPLNAIHFKDGVGWAVGGNGLILRTDNWTTWIDQNTGQKYPAQYELFQNYPNPFNPKTVIRYLLPVTSHLELSIYNILGQKVATLVNKKQSAGSFQVEWDASGFASGVYLYKLETGNGYRQVKKLVLLK